MSKYSQEHPSEVFKYCPHCGNPQFTFDNIKKFICNHCKFEYYINAATAVCGIIEVPGNKIILTRRKYSPKAGMLDLPGGFVDTMEKAEDALIREIKEELNIDVVNPQFLSSFPNEYPFKGFTYYTCDLAFIIKLEHVPEINATDDITEGVLVSPHEIDFETIGFESIKKILMDYKSKLAAK